MSYSRIGAVQVKDEDALRNAIAKVRDDKSEENFVLLGYEEGKSNCIELVATGCGGLAELLTHLTPQFLGYAMVRVISGDKESHRPKFIQISYAGEQIGLVKKGKMGTHISSINQLFGYTHIHVQASSQSDLQEDDLMSRVKKAGGADYDCGSNKYGY